MAQKNKTNIEQEALTLVRTEKAAWETATAFVTEKVAFEMRNLIRLLRKNYYGIFDTPIDPITGRQKIWVPLTESLCESVIKNIDLDTKDINFRAKNAKAVPLTSIVRNVVKNGLDNIFFGETLDMMERNLTIDGTIVWKTLEKKDEDTGRVIPDIRPVDLLNFYIDPVASSIKETGAIIERSVMTPEEVRSHKDWLNTEDITGQINVNLNDGELGGYSGYNSGGGQTKYVEVYERWGQMPKFLMTGKQEDRDKQVEGRIVCSGTGNDWRVHLIEETDGKKPYEECWYTRVPGRWYGKGIAEKVMWLQVWTNTIVNIRINRSYVSQLGIFKVKRGAGITPQMIGRLATNGAITVSNMQDIEQLAMQEASQASYKDEEVIQGWAERVTSAFETVTGESLPSTTTATTASIQNRSGMSQFILIKKQIGLFLQRWVKNQYLPIVQKNIKVQDIVRITGEPEELRELDELQVNRVLADKLIEMNEMGLFANPQQIELEKQVLISELQKQGKDRFITILNKVPWDEYDVQVYVTNEEMDKPSMVQNLIQTLQLAPEFRENILRQLYDVMGLNSDLLRMSPQMQQAQQMQQMQGQPQMPGQPAQMVAPNEAAV